MKADHSRGIGWFTIQLTLMALQLMVVFVKRAQWPESVSKPTGVALLTVAGASALLGLCSLGRNLTPLPEPKKHGELVTTGIYARIRHPIYTSLMTAGFGWALLWQSWPALLLAVAQALFLREKAKNEEKRLCTKFPEYDAYTLRVPRFLPRLLSGRKHTSTL